MIYIDSRYSPMSAITQTCHCSLCIQVVAGMNFKAHLTICGHTVDVQFYVPLPVNGEPQMPQDVQLLSGQL